MKMIRHSIVMITYNQENLLPMALDSVLSQTVLPYEVIIGDDCSSDKTWEVIMEYHKKYPNIIKPVRQENNLGIFGNINSLIHLPTGDVISMLSGDDLYKPGILEAFNEKIKENNLDVSDKWILISNAIDLHPDGKEVIYDNYKYRDRNLFKVKLRYALNFRETGFSRALWREISPIRQDLGYHADWLFTLDQIEKSDAFYFINRAFPVYRLGVGVISKSKRKQLFDSRIKTVDVILKKYKTLLDNDDIRYLNKEKQINGYLLAPSVYNFFNSLYCLVSNWNNYEQKETRLYDLKSCFFFIGKTLRFLGLR
ncbi:glycosyltransferase family 2 protein [Capnocytophaga cynodegmi]|uniref:glycosyltransferase family 2 protein n=1 Tax=Capnocytophaga cynodegmi TaxID=28189 RepID=UPI001EE19F7A|nr:glycosyltransferase family 2 protein [Capnocytophaga cynodegmi]